MAECARHSLHPESNAEGGAEYHLHREGGHSHRRIVHAADATGRAIQTTLEQRARQHPNITLNEQCSAIDLITGRKLGLGGNRCLGAYVLNRHTGQVEVCAARFVVLATRRRQPGLPLFQQSGRLHR